MTVKEENTYVWLNIILLLTPIDVVPELHTLPSREDVLLRAGHDEITTPAWRRAFRPFCLIIFVVG